MAFEVIKPSFERGLRWRLGSGITGKVGATMEDPAFWEAVKEGATFAAGDTLVADVKYRALEQPDGSIVTEYSIVKGKKHRRRGRQATMFEDQ